MQSRKEREQAARRRKRSRRYNALYYTVTVLILVGCSGYLWRLFGTPEAGSGPPGTDAVATFSPSADRTAPPAVSPASSPTPSPTPSSAELPRVTMNLVGDVMLGSRVGELIAVKGYDYPYRHVRSILADADVTAANLESAVTDGGEQQNKQYTFRASPKALPALREAGVDLVNLANNHSMDYGIPGLLDTFRHLLEAGIPYVGAGRNIEETYRPHVIEVRGVKIAFVGLTRVYEEPWWQAGSEPGVAGTYDYRVPQALEAIRSAKSVADLAVVIVHWGIERKETPADYQLELARKYIDAGADLIVGGHPHVLQGFERYKGKWVAYSLGNFVFTVNNHPLTWNSMILQASCTAKGDCELRVVPVSAKKLGEPEPMTGEEADQLLAKLSGLSINASVGKDGKVRAAGERTPQDEAGTAGEPSPSPRPSPSARQAVPSAKPSTVPKPSTAPPSAPKPSANPSTVPSSAPKPSANPSTVPSSAPKPSAAASPQSTASASPAATGSVRPSASASLRPTPAFSATVRPSAGGPSVRPSASPSSSSAAPLPSPR